MIYKLRKGTTISCTFRGSKEPSIEMKIPEDLFLDEKYIDGLHTFNISYLFFNTELDCFVTQDRNSKNTKIVVMWMKTNMWKPLNNEDTH